MEVQGVASIWDMGSPSNNQVPKAVHAQSGQPGRTGKFNAEPITAADYFSLASFLHRREQLQRGVRRESHSEAIRTAGEQFEHREYVAAYETFKPVYDRIVTDMQRVLARNSELEAKKVAAQQGKSLALAKENVQQMRAHAQQLADQFEKLRQDLEHKPLVRLHLKKRTTTTADVPQAKEPPPTIVSSTDETRVGAEPIAEPSTLVGDERYRKAPYAPPEIGSLYTVRDKSQAERIIKVISISADGELAQVELLDSRSPKRQSLELAVQSLAHQASKGWCHSLVPLAKESDIAANPEAPSKTNESEVA